jgi:hypothetical protein
MAVNSQGKFTKLTDDVVKKLEEIFLLDGTVEEACFLRELANKLSIIGSKRTQKCKKEWTH